MNFRFVSTSSRVEAGIAAALIFFGASEAFAQSDGAQPAPNPTPPAATAGPAEALPPAQTPTPTPAQPTTSASIGSCSRDELAALHREAPRFLVEVHARQGSTTTTGVIIEGNRVLIPNVNVIKQGWPITVYFGDGKQSSAKLVADLKFANFAVISIDSPPPGLAPRSFVQTKPEIGMPLVSVGKPLHGEKNIAWEMRSSSVSGVLDDLIRASIATEPGAPLLNCSGQVVAVQQRKIYDVSPEPEAITGAALAKAIANPPKNELRGYIAYGILDPMAVLALRPGETGVGGRITFVEMGFSPRFFLKANIGAQWLTVPEKTDYATATDITRWRFQFEGLIGLNQRFALGSPAEGFIDLNLSPYLGIASRSDHTSLRRLKADGTTVAQSSTEDYADPLIGVRLELFKIATSYQFQLNLKAPRESIHTLGLGVHF